MWQPTPEDLKHALLKVRGVQSVQPHSKGSKSLQQGFRGGHAQETNWHVKVEGCSRPIEFELTKHGNMDSHKTGTKRGEASVTAVFKTPPRGMHGQIWRILKRVGLWAALFPEEVREWSSEYDQMDDEASDDDDDDDLGPPQVTTLRRDNAPSADVSTSGSTSGRGRRVWGPGSPGWVVEPQLKMQVAKPRELAPTLPLRPKRPTPKLTNDTASVRDVLRASCANFGRAEREEIAAMADNHERILRAYPKVKHRRQVEMREEVTRDEAAEGGQPHREEEAALKKAKLQDPSNERSSVPWQDERMQEDARAAWNEVLNPGGDCPVSPAKADSVHRSGEEDGDAGVVEAEGGAAEVPPVEAAPAQVVPTVVAPAEVAGDPAEETPAERAPAEEPPEEVASGEEAPDWDAPPEEAAAEVAPGALTKEDFRSESNPNECEKLVLEVELPGPASEDAHDAPPRAALELAHACQVELELPCLESTSSSAADGGVQGQPLAALPENTSSTLWQQLWNTKIKPFQKSALVLAKERTTDKQLRHRGPDPIPVEFRVGAERILQWIREQDTAVWEQYTEVISADHRDWKAWMQAGKARGLDLMCKLRDNHNGVQSEYACLTLSMPDVVGEKFDKDPNAQDERTKFADLLKLCNKMGGEYVEFCNGLDHTWDLVDGACPTMPPRGGEKTELTNSQFLCRPPVWEKQRCYAPPPVRGGDDAWGKMNIRRVDPREAPDWSKQVHRLLCPCVGRPDRHWVRSVRVINMFNLFILLGKEFCADLIFAWYNAQRVVVTKMQPHTTATSRTKKQAMPDPDTMSEVTSEFQRAVGMPAFADAMGWAPEDLPTPRSRQAKKTLEECALRHMTGLILKSVDAGPAVVTPNAHPTATLATFSLAWEAIRHVLLTWQDSRMQVLGNDAIPINLGSKLASDVPNPPLDTAFLHHILSIRKLRGANLWQRRVVFGDSRHQPLAVPWVALLHPRDTPHGISIDCIRIEENAAGTRCRNYLRRSLVAWRPFATNTRQSSRAPWPCHSTLARCPVFIDFIYNRRAKYKVVSPS